ncbi:hypothetical protein ACIQTN_25680 [Streptomyces werraensis]|uniref:hypothetical protein n=1 Tax=Streptomyces werraensis TaxID=68284 RepID=UPI0037FE0A4B
MTASVHWHAFAYTGKGYTDGEVSKGIAPASFPPRELPDWLDRRPGLRVYTEAQIDEAVAWLEQEMREQPPVDAASFPVATRLGYSRARLRQQAGRDVLHGYWSTRGQFVTRALVACTGTERAKGCA